AAAVLIVVLSASVVSLRHDVDNLHDRTAAPDPIALAAGRALTEPSSRVAKLAGAGGMSAVTVVGADGQGYLLGDALPDLDHKVYELWGQGPAGDVTALGTVPGPGVYAFTTDPS